MEKVVLGNLKEELQKDNLNLSERMPKDSLEDKMLFLETELDGLEKEMIYHTLRFLETKNEYGTNVITGVSSCIYIPSLDGEDDYSFKIISGERGRDSKEQMDEDTIYDIASVTKLFTLILLLKLDDLGYLSLNEKICDINPDFQGLEDFTLNDLMRLHGKYWTDGNVAKASSKEEAERILKTIHLTDNTRLKNTYNDFGAIIIADTIAKRMSQVHNKELTYEDVLKMYLLEPLGMNHTCYNPKTDNVSGNGFGINVVHDPKARALGGMCGHAGLFTNATDLNLLAKDIFAGVDGKGKVLNKKIVEKLGEITFPNSASHAKGNLGVYVKCKEGLKKSYVSNLSAKGSFAHEGWTGSLAVFDPYNRIHQSVLVNAVYPIDSKDEIKNDKPVFYMKALREYQERLTVLGLKMRFIKNEYDVCKRILNETEEKPLTR